MPIIENERTFLMIYRALPTKLIVRQSLIQMPIIENERTLEMLFRALPTKLIVRQSL